MEQAGSLQLACEQERKPRAQTEVTERKLSEAVTGSQLQSTVKNAGWRTRSEGRTDAVDRGEIRFQTVKAVFPTKPSFALL